MAAYSSGLRRLRPQRHAAKGRAAGRLRGREGCPSYLALHTSEPNWTSELEVVGDGLDPGLDWIGHQQVVGVGERSIERSRLAYLRRS